MISITLDKCIVMNDGIFIYMNEEL